MTLDRDTLERLITRVLDDEATPADRAALDAACAADDEARALFEAHRRMDAALGTALRAAFSESDERVAELGGVCRFESHGTLTRATPHESPNAWHNHPFFRKHRRLRIGQYALGAIAASIAAFAWFQPGMTTRSDEFAPADARRANLLQARTISGDVVAPMPSEYEQPEVRVRGTDREWILIPADKPGLYWVVEVDRERTHVLPVQKDF